MAQGEKEIEVKFLLADLPALQARLEDIASLVSPRIFENNLRFDTPDGSLAQRHAVLRLRQDSDVRLTYKGPGTDEGGVHARTEIEFTAGSNTAAGSISAAGSFTAALHFLQALGYAVVMRYEKYRTTYQLGEVIVTLDEMPFGSFVELEGPHAAALQDAAAILQLDWDARITQSYVLIFDELRHVLNLPFTDLTFEYFRSIPSPLAPLHFTTADSHS